MSQNDKLYLYLKKHKTIDPMRALKELGCFRLGARIWDLRQSGYRIHTTMKPVKTRDGGETRVAEYRLA